MAKAPQTYENHRRLDPGYHIVLFGLFLANAVAALVAFIRHPGGSGAWAFVMALALLFFFLKLRGYALHNQDRLIRLEERLRLERLLPGDLKARIPELRMNQLVGLRFASDGELADRTREALDDHLDLAAIKKRIQVWRPDTFRV
jgi:hypothetical protein